MKSLLALFALGLLGVGMAACGGSSSSSNAASAARASTAEATTHPPDTTSPAAPSSVEAHGPIQTASRSDREKYDRDEDDYVHVPDDNNPNPPNYATLPPGEARALAALVKRYYAAALKGNGARACSMMSAAFVKAIPLDYGKLGPVFLRHVTGTCVAVLSALFKHEHALLAHEVPTMRIVRVSVGGTQADAFLRFGALHERFISLRRDGGVWTIASVLDGELE